MNLQDLSDKPHRDQHPDQVAINVTAFLKVVEKQRGQYADENEINQGSPDYAAEVMQTVVKRKTIRREQWPDIRHRGNHTHAASSQYCSCLHEILYKTPPRKSIHPTRSRWRRQTDATRVHYNVRFPEYTDSGSQMFSACLYSSMGASQRQQIDVSVNRYCVDASTLLASARQTMAAVIRKPIELWSRIPGGVTLHLVKNREAK
jgi:hypothetical protein